MKNNQDENTIYQYDIKVTEKEYLDVMTCRRKPEMPKWVNCLRNCLLITVVLSLFCLAIAVTIYGHDNTYYDANNSIIEDVRVVNDVPDSIFIPTFVTFLVSVLILYVFIMYFKNHLYKKCRADTKCRLVNHKG